MTGVSRELVASRLPLAAAILSAAVAWLMESAPLGFLAVLCFILYLTVKVWGKWVLHRVEYHRRFTVERCTVGETVGLDVELTNRKLLPITQMTVDDSVPEQLKLSAKTLISIAVGKNTLRFLFGLGWYERVIRHYKVTPTRRGFYQLGPATIRSGDPFGFVEREMSVPERSQLVVFPKIVPLAEMGLPSRRPFGDLSSRDRLFEDPVRFAGVRDYQPGDPLGRVHWKATAATGKLQVKVLDPSSHVGLAIFLNTWSFEYFWQGTDPEAFETGCSVAASVAAWAQEEGVPFGLFANGFVNGWGLSLRQRVGRGADQLPLALEGLARLESFSQEAIWRLMAEEVGGLTYGTSVVVISRMVTPELAAGLVSARATGRPVTLLRVGNAEGELPPLPGIRVYHIPDEEALPHVRLA